MKRANAREQKRKNGFQADHKPQTSPDTPHKQQPVKRDPPQHTKQRRKLKKQDTFRSAQQPARRDSQEDVSEKAKNRSTPLFMNSPNSDTWLYVSGVANDFPATDVKGYLSERLSCQDIDCYFLLPRGTDPRSRRSLSFKVRIPSSCAHVALLRNFWPMGISARYFV